MNIRYLVSNKAKKYGICKALRLSNNPNDFVECLENKFVFGNVFRDN